MKDLRKQTSYLNLIKTNKIISILDPFKNILMNIHRKFFRSHGKNILGDSPSYWTSDLRFNYETTGCLDRRIQT